jgi:hypothetical protein
VNALVMEYRNKVASLSPRNKRIWELVHTMLNEALRSENAALQDCYKSSARHNEASKAAEDELLRLLTTEEGTENG